MGVTRLSAYVFGGLALWAAVLASGVHATLAGFFIELMIPLRIEGNRPSPLLAAERHLRPWVALGIVPVFACFNAGVQIVDLTAGALATSIAVGAAAALVFGKPIRILLAGWGAARMGVAELPLPSRENWMRVSGAALLAGIKFTMSMFFIGLAFGTRETMTLSATTGVLIGSLLSAVLGVSFLTLTADQNRQT